MKTPMSTTTGLPVKKPTAKKKVKRKDENTKNEDKKKVIKWIILSEKMILTLHYIHLNPLYVNSKHSHNAILCHFIYVYIICVYIYIHANK